MEGQGLQDQQDAMGLCGLVRNFLLGLSRRRGDTKSTKEGEVKMLNFERWILNLARKLR